MFSAIVRLMIVRLYFRDVYYFLINNEVSLCVGAPSFSRPSSDINFIVYFGYPLAHVGTIVASLWFNDGRFGHISESVWILFFHQHPSVRHRKLETRVKI